MMPTTQAASLASDFFPPQKSISRSNRLLLGLLLASSLLHITLLYQWRFAKPSAQHFEYFQPAVQVRLREARITPIPEVRETPPAKPVVKETPKETPKEVPKTTSAPSKPAEKPAPANAQIIRSQNSNDFAVAPPATAPTAPAATETAPAPSIADMMENAKHSAGKIDKDLRAGVTGPARAGLLGTEGPNKLARDIAKAGVVREYKVETIYAANGQQFTKHTGPGGSYCIWVPKADRAFGQGGFEQPQSKVTTCPE